MQAVGSVDSSPPVQRRRGRPPRGRGRGRGGRGRLPALTPAADRSSSENEAGETVPCEEFISEGVPSDRAEDSDDLNLQEIRKRAVARKIQELKHEGDAAAQGPADLDAGLGLLLQSEDPSGGGEVCSSTATSGAQDTTAGGRALEELQELSENSEEDTERNNPHAVCGTCQQGHSNRSMICCDSCRTWRHVDCAGVAETCAHLLQRNGGYVCPSCSNDQDAMRTNGLSQKSEIDSTHMVEVTQPVEDEMKEALPKCIGPGCSNDSLPESVYCGHQCIVRHAAVAMKSLSEPKLETKPAAPPADLPLKSEKRSFLAKLFKVKMSKTPAQEECVSKQEKDEECPCSAAAVEPVGSSPAPDHKPTVTEKVEVECSSSTPQINPSDVTPDVSSSEKVPAAPLMKKSTPGRAKKTMPGSPRLELLKGALGRSALSIPKKPCESKAPVESSKAAEVVTCGPWELEPAAAPRASPLLMRQNIRRSLSTVLCRRFSQTDDLKISESEIEKMAVDMEKEMFNVCYTTDEDYNNKYQYLVLTLKDPQNKELCHQVLKGHMPSAKLIQLSQQEESAADPLLQTPVKEELGLLSEDVEEPATTPEKVMSPSTSTPSEEKWSLKLPQAKEICSGAPDVISCMLKDTTGEHKRHLFDLNCRICTGQVSTDDDPESKKPKMPMVKEETEEEKSSGVVRVMDEALDSDIIESPASPSGEDLHSQTPSADFSPVLIPSVPTVSISRRDPRTAQYRQAAPPSEVPEPASVPQQPPVKNTPEPLTETLPTRVSAPLSAPMPKSILMKPSPASLDTAYGSTTRLAECDKGTKQFLSQQNILWKGFLNMPTVAKFVTKGYLISGSPDFLKEDLPDTIHIGGRILPQTVWEYVDLIKTSEAKELSLIRFHPSSEEEEVAYVSLFSYFNSRRRFGVVSNICKHIKDLYLIPLSKKQSIPAVLLPIDGPGLEQNHPNLLMGLAVCQKPKRPEAVPQDVGEKTPRSLMCSDGKGTSSPISLCDPGQHSIKACDAGILLSSNPAGSLPDPSCPAGSLWAPSVPNPSPSVHAGPSKDSTNNTPLQTILNTLFGQKKQPSDVTECKISSLTDSVSVEQTCKDDDALILGDDRPYDPEEYDPACSNEAMGSFSPAEVSEPKGPSAVTDDDDDRPYDPEEEYSAAGSGVTVRNNTQKASEAKHTEESSIVSSDIAYDPEDETMFEEMQSYLTSNAIPHKSTVCENNMSHYKENTSVTTFTEQQKILEELNRQIEEQKRQLEEQTETLRLQKEAIGVSMAHFSVSKALMSPTRFDGDEEESIENIPYCPIIHQSRDPRMCRKTSQDMPADDAECEAIDKESVEKILNTDEVVLNKSFTTKKEKLVTDKGKPKEGSPDTKSAQQKSTKCSQSEYAHKNQGSRRSTLSTYRSSRRRSWQEHRSYHQDRASSRASRTVRSSKDDSDKHHRSRHSAGHLSSTRHSDKKGVTTSRKRHYHHHRDSSSPPRYRRRSHYSPVSHSSRRDKSSQDDSDQSRKTDLSEQNIKSAQHESGQVPDSSIQSTITSGQSARVEGEAANCKDRCLAEVQKGAPPNTKHEADQKQGLKTFQNPGEGCSQPLLNKSYENKQTHSVLSEMKRENLPPNQTDSALLPTPCLAHGATDLPLDRDSPALQPSGIQTIVFHHDTNPTHNQTDTFSEPVQIDQKRNMPSMQRPNYSRNETDKLHSGDYPQRSFHSQYRNVSQTDTDQFSSRELPQNKRGKFMLDADNNNPPHTSHKQEEFSTASFVHQNPPNHRPRRFPRKAADQVHQSQPPRPDQLHECDFEEPETTGLCHKKYTSYKQGQNFHEDESVQFQQRESLLGPPPVHKGNFRPPNPREHFHPSTFDKWKPSRGRPSLMKRRSPEFAHPPRDGNSGSSTNFGPRGQSSGFGRYEGPTKDLQPSGPFAEEMFESPGPAGPIGSKDPSPRPCSFRRGRGRHRGSRQVMHDRTHLMNSAKLMNIPNAEGPSERQVDARDPRTTPTSKPQMPHLANPSGYAQDICEPQTPDCPQTFAEDAEDPIHTGFSRPAPTHSQGPAHGAMHGRFEGQQYTEIEGQPRGLQKFRGRRRGIVGPFYARGHRNNAQVRGPNFDSPQQFLGQREPSLGLHRRRRPSPQNCDRFDDHTETHSSDFPDPSTTTPPHFTKPQHKHLGRPPANLESRLRQTNIRPLRLSGPLLPTPPGGPIRRNLSRGRGQNTQNECHRDYLT